MVANCTACHPDLDTLTDEELVTLTRGGSNETFVCLFRRHHASYMRLALGLVRNESDASDVVQSAYERMYSKLHTFHGGGSFAGWSHRIVRNSGLMLLRRRKRRREVDIDVAPTSAFRGAGYASPLNDPDAALKDKQVREAVSTLLDRLEPKYRRALELRELEGKSMAEIGRELDLSVGGAKTRLHRARSFMKVWLENEYGLAPAA